MVSMLCDKKVVKYRVIIAKHNFQNTVLKCIRSQMIAMVLLMLNGKINFTRNNSNEPLR